MDSDEALSLISARVPELGPTKLALIAAALKGEMLPASALEDVMILLELAGGPARRLHGGRWMALGARRG